jgi:hypothetical protein
MESRYRTAVRTNEAKEVAMNKFDGVIFRLTKPCIGTDQLGSCTAVMIVSSTAAILGHVAPRPDIATYEHAGDHHVEQFMDRLLKYRWVYESYFPPNANAWVVCAIFRGEVALPDQQKIIISKLTEDGYTVDASRTYEVPYTATNPDRGSVFIDGRGDAVRIFVEDRIIHTIQKDSPAATTSQASVSTQSTATTPQNGHQGSGGDRYHQQPATAAPSPAVHGASSNTPGHSFWDGTQYVNSQNTAYIWRSGTWVKRSTTASTNNPTITAPISAVHQTPSTQPSTWTWSAEHQRYYRWANGVIIWANQASSS